MGPHTVVPRIGEEEEPMSHDRFFEATPPPSSFSLKCVAQPVTGREQQQPVPVSDLTIGEAAAENNGVV